ncbi:hypothetical protein JCM11641_002302, partial [Rhodosporidiobolus odoratus]
MSNAFSIFSVYAIVWLAIVVWDTLATFSLEYRFVWKSRWSFLKIAFLFKYVRVTRSLSRYWTPICMLLEVIMVKARVPADLCQHIAVFHPAGALVTIILVLLILIELAAMVAVTTQSE